VDKLKLTSSSSIMGSCVRTSLVTLFLLAESLIALATPVIASGQQTQSTIPACSSTQLYGSAGTFTVCTSSSTYDVNMPATITMNMTNTSPGNLFFYSARLDIVNNGNSVFSAVESCPTQFACPTSPGLAETVTFNWTATGPVGLDTVQGTVYWDYGCRILGCLVSSPPPATTSLNVTVQPSESVGGSLLPVDKLALLAPYIVFASLLVASFAISVYTIHARRGPGTIGSGQ
jgi:hypothetical protein